MYNKQFDEYLKCIDEERFYDAHEAIESLWFPRRFEDKCEIKLLKGFINAAVSFELHKRGRFPQSKRVWANYLKYRPLLYKTNSIHKNRYHSMARHIERRLQKIRASSH